MISHCATPVVATAAQETIDLDATISILLERLLKLINCREGAFAVVDTNVRGFENPISAFFCSSVEPPNRQVLSSFLRGLSSDCVCSGCEQRSEKCCLGGLDAGGRLHGKFRIVCFAVVQHLCLLLALPNESSDVLAHATPEMTSLRRQASGALERHLVRRAAESIGQHFEFVGLSEPVMHMEIAIKRAASLDMPVLIVGERGVGKEAVAFALHYYSKRRGGPFMVLNAAALSSELYVTELFGWRKGAFTGAVTDRSGRIEAADAGTLFLDEISECSPSIYPGLLRALEYGEIQRPGEDRTRRVNARIVAATNRDLARLVRENKFPADLFDRLNVVSIKVPPLRERMEDARLLVNYYVLKNCQNLQALTRSDFCAACKQDGVPRCVPSDLPSWLSRHVWPGNIRELKNLVLRIIACRGTADELAFTQPHRLPVASAGSRSTIPVASLEDALRNHVLMALELSNWNKSAAARALCIPLSTLVSKMRRLGISRQMG